MIGFVLYSCRLRALLYAQYLRRQETDTRTVEPQSELPHRKRSLTLKNETLDHLRNVVQYIREVFARSDKALPINNVMINAHKTVSAYIYIYICIVLRPYVPAALVLKIIGTICYIFLLRCHRYRTCLNCRYRLRTPSADSERPTRAPKGHNSLSQHSAVLV